MGNKYFFTTEIRSSLCFLILLALATGFTVFILTKAQEAVSEINRLSEGQIFLLRNALDAGSSRVADVSNWKTYRNEKYGFEVRYPSSWTARECTKVAALDTTSCVQIGAQETDSSLRIYVNPPEVGLENLDFKLVVEKHPVLQDGVDARFQTIHDAKRGLYFMLANITTKTNSYFISTDRHKDIPSLEVYEQILYTIKNVK